MENPEHNCRRFSQQYKFSGHRGNNVGRAGKPPSKSVRRLRLRTSALRAAAVTWVTSRPCIIYCVSSGVHHYYYSCPQCVPSHDLLALSPSGTIAHYFIVASYQTIASGAYTYSTPLTCTLFADRTLFQMCYDGKSYTQSSHWWLSLVKIHCGRF